MRNHRASIVLAATALLSAAAGGAHAADRGKAVDFTVKSEPMTVAPNPGRALRYDASKGRLGFTLNIQQPDDRPAVANDVQAGAYYKVTPSISVGGAGGVTAAAGADGAVSGANGAAARRTLGPGPGAEPTAPIRLTASLSMS